MELDKMTDRYFRSAAYFGGGHSFADRDHGGALLVAGAVGGVGVIDAFNVGFQARYQE